MTNLLDGRWLRLASFLAGILAWQSVMGGEASAQVNPTPATLCQDGIEEAQRLSVEVTALSNRGAFDEAMPKAARALEIHERIFGREHPAVAAALSNIGFIFFRKNDHAKAREYYRRALDIRDKLKLETHDAATLLNNLGLLDLAQGDRDGAEEDFRRALAMQEKRPDGLEAPLTATIRYNLASVLSVKGDHEGAEKLFRAALTIREKQWELAGGDIILTLNNLALTHHRMHRYDEALRLYNRALRIADTFERDPPAALPVISNLLTMALEDGNYPKAEVLARRGMALLESNPGNDLFYVAQGYNTVGQFYRAKVDYEKAEQYSQRALSTLEAAALSEHTYAAEVRISLGLIYVEQGEYDKAEEHFEKARALRRIALGAGHQDYATSLTHLADLNRRRGRYVEAEPMLKEALEIYRKTVGGRHPYSATVMNNLGILYLGWGDRGRAEDQLKQALDIREQALRPGHPDIAVTLINLSRIYSGTGRWDEEATLLLRARTIFEQARGPESPQVARTLTDLGLVHHRKGERRQAESLLRRAVEINEKVFGQDHIELTPALNNLALLYHYRNDLDKAEPIYRRALGIYEKSGLLKHPWLADLLENLSQLYTARGDIARALSSADRAGEIEEYNLDLMLAGGSETRNRAQWLALQDLINVKLSLHTLHAPNDNLAARLALTTVFRWKGRVLDAMAGSVQALRASTNPEDKKLLDEYEAVRSELAARIAERQYATDGVFNTAQLVRLEEKYQRLEARVSDRVAQARGRSRPVTIEDIQQLIPEGAALVEFVSYRPFDAKALRPAERWKPRRYMAYVLRRRGEPTWADLGEAAAIEDDISNLRPALRDRKRLDVADLARKVDVKVMRPVRNLLDQTRWFLISPDAMLQLIPFEALVDERGRYLADGYLFTYLSSARDLPRLQFPAPSEQPPVIVANPAFNLRPGEVGPPASGFSTPPARPPIMHFESLDGTEDEAYGIAKLLTLPRVLTGPAATTTALKQLHSPSILHIATHGFFAAESESTSPTRINGEEVFKSSIVTLFLDLYRAREGVEHIASLSQSGIALAGANVVSQHGEDGLLTAFEVSGLDLRGTKLAVLSACETGVGDVELGNGLYGLRRSLVIAGAESQVLSLWKVNDEATREIMVAFYTRLRAGVGRSEALSQARLERLRSADHSHPYFWAAFIQSGDWRSIEGISD